MKIRNIVPLLEADVLCCNEDLDTVIYHACSSDMMSDVLAFANDNTSALLTGLVNPQVVRTAMMVDIRCIIFVRGKTPSQDIIDLAQENHIVLLVTQLHMFEACGRLFVNMNKEKE